MKSTEEYVIEKWFNQGITNKNVEEDFEDCYNYAKLMVKRPELRDFIGYEAIFKDFKMMGQVGNVYRISNGSTRIDFINGECKYETIEELPKEVEFREGVI